MEEWLSSVKKEIATIIDRGIAAGNIEILYNLVDIYKDLENVRYWHCKEEYYANKAALDIAMESHYDGVKDMVSSSMSDYMSSKRVYEQSKDVNDKKKMLSDLKSLMENYGIALKDLWLNSSSDDERAIIKDLSNKQRIF